MKNEKRRFDREAISLPVHYKVFNTQDLENEVVDDNLNRLGVLQDLSVGGVQIVTGNPVREGQILELEVEVPGFGKTRTLAKIVWARPATGPPRQDWRCGIQFVPVYQEDLQKVREYFGLVGD